MAGLYFVIGFFTFAPHVLIGLFARELCPSKPSTAGGFVKALGQIGGAFAGAPLMYIVATYDWKAAFYLWIAAGVCAGLCFLPLWSVKPTKAVAVKKKTQ
uniref:Major facilitator superfamily (MFS) profile domain-containing protein n=1 Tax=Lotharella oceanica TaxID=641309 RepID=A0A7S2TRC1_9EUKA